MVSHQYQTIHVDMVPSTPISTELTSLLSKKGIQKKSISFFFLKERTKKITISYRIKMG